MISYRRLVALVAGLLGSAVLRADSFAANSFSAYYLSGREVYNSGCSDTGSAEAACISSTPMGIRTTSSAGFGQNGLFQEGIAFARVDTAAVESDRFQYYYSEGAASFTVNLVISGGDGTGFLLPDCLGVALWGPVGCTTSLPFTGSYFQFVYDTPFEISGRVWNGVSEWNAYTSWVLLRGVNIYDSQSTVATVEVVKVYQAVETITSIPEPAAWLLVAGGLAILLRRDARATPVRRASARR